MTVQPKFHWQFEEREGTEVVDRVSGAQGTLSDTKLEGHGRVGNGVHLTGLLASINLGKEVGQFGSNDFTIAFGMKVINSHGNNEMDIIGSQSMKGHGNFFSVRLAGQNRIFFHVDESGKATHYVKVFTDPLSQLREKTWFHVTVVRRGRAIEIYIDGAPAVKSESKTGVANISNGTDVRLGHWRRGTPTAQYEDLRVYDTALGEAEIRALLPVPNPPLNNGEIELVASDRAVKLLKQDVADLARLSPLFQRLRLGPDTGVTLYKEADFSGVAQKLMADIPEIRFTKLGDFPRSVRIWSAAGEPFTGKWTIKAPNGQYLSRRGAALVTAPHRLLEELFVFHHSPRYDLPLLLPATDQEGLLLKVQGENAVLLVDDSEPDQEAFSIVGPPPRRWLQLSDDTFGWTDAREDRAIFFRAAKMADNEGQVGELALGEVALYEHRAYHGRTWILSGSTKDVAGDYKRLSSFHGLNDQVSSVRLGPNTGVTLFRNEDNATDADRETEIQDITENVPDLQESQVGDDSVSSIKIFKSVPAEELFTSVTSKLSQDYRMVGDELEEFSAYRTILRLKPNGQSATATKVAVSATDLTTIEVDGATHEIDEARSVSLSPNELNLIMITSEADGLDTPGLKFRTEEMAPNERVVIFPNKEVHQQISMLEEGALWNAKDADGKLIVDRSAHSEAEVARVQNTIKRTMATLGYVEDTQAQSAGGKQPRLSSRQVVSGANIGKPWELTFKPAKTNNGSTPSPSGDNPLPTFAAVAAPALIEEQEVSSDEWARLLEEATPVDDADSPTASDSPTALEGTVLAVRAFKPLRQLRNTLKDAVSVVVGAAENVVRIIVKTAEGVFAFVVDTAKKVVEFVEAVVEKVVDGIKKFIEFLRFLFNWDDILETQRYLKRVLNGAIDSAGELVASAKPRVSAFFDDLQETVEDSMNRVVKVLGGTPSEPRGSGFEIPEALEWFLSRLLGGLRRPGANLGTNRGGQSAIDSFLKNLLAALENVINAGARGAEGLIEAVKALIESPKRPEQALIALIEAMRDMAILLLEAGEDLTLALLDVVLILVEEFRVVLNAEIHIPFISRLFKRLGAGGLSIMNLTTLMLAIPATVTSKLITQRKPDTTGPLPLDLSSQGAARLAAVSSTEAGIVLPPGEGGVPEPAGATETEEEESLRTLRRNLSRSVFTTSADVVNHRLNMLLDAIDPPDDINRLPPLTANQLRAAGMLECVSYFLGVISLGFSYPAVFDKGESPKGASRILEPILWGYRIGVTALDGAILFDKSKRMRRLEECVIPWAVLSAIDLALAIATVATDDENDAKARDIVNEVFGTLPSLLTLRQLVKSPPQAVAVGWAALVLSNGVASLVALTTGALAIHSDAEALREGLAARRVSQGAAPAALPA